MDTERLAEYAADFAERLHAREFDDHIADHRRRSERAQELLQAERIPSLTEEELRELLEDTDAAGAMYGRKRINDALAEERRDGLLGLLAEVVRLGQGEVTPGELQPLFSYGLGALLPTELLGYRFPDRYYTYSRNVTLEALFSLGQPIWFEMPHGQRNDHHVYVTLAPYMEQVRDALREAGVPDPDYLVTDVFLWWVKNTLTPLPSIEDLVRVLGETERTKENMAITVPFIDAVLHSFGIQVPDVTTFRPKKSAPDPNPQYLAYGTARILEPMELRDGKSTTSLNLMVQVSPGRQSSSGEIFWGYHLWGTEEWRDIVHKVLENHRIVRHDETMEVRAGPGALGVSPEVWGGGHYFAAGKFISRDDLAAQYTDTAELVQAIADDLVAWHSEWSEVAEKVEAELRERVGVRRYWKISPGEGARLWDEFQRRSIIAHGYGGDLDLREHEAASKEDVRSILAPTGDYEGGKLPFAAGVVWQFYGEMKPGDYVVAYGNKQALGWGVVGEYFVDPDFEYPQCRKVQWKSTKPRSLDGASEKLRTKLGAIATLFELTAEEFDEIWAEEPPPPVHILPLLQSRLRAQGFRFDDWQVACFYTALQTKGFVLLSGISGTGKTKLAQLFADMLPQPRAIPRPSEDIITVTVKPYMLRYNRVIIPRQSLHLFSPPPPGETRDVTIIFPGGEQQCALTHAKYERTEYVQIMFRGEAREWVRENLAEGDQLILEPALADTGDLTGFRLASGDDPDRAAAAGAELEPGSNHLFLPVRPDWRDSKSLLGYYNPLDNAYHWTEFLRFLVRARESYEAGDGLAWFVILDEMNLAHVEYYFADLLSVMESGRDPETSLTREALRLDCPEDAEGELPPAQLHLPPNLYVIGTVNVDETTQAFSPKVLDRAFTIEFNEVSFADYPPAFEGEAEDLSDGMRRGLLAQFTGGDFALISKERIAQTAAAHPVYRTWLETLNEGLREHGLHFGYRVFDEIQVFLARAEENGVFEEQGGLEGAFDAAVLMKVLPKFNGSRAKLEAPLVHVLAWCLQPDRPDETRVIEALREDDALGIGALPALSALPCHLPKTAAKAIRLMRALQTDGFAAFGG